jgi:hypothetical protein
VKSVAEQADRSGDEGEHQLDGYYRTSSPVTALPMIMRWISAVPSKIVKLVEVQPVSAGRWPVQAQLVSTGSARLSPLLGGAYGTG